MIVCMDENEDIYKRSIGKALVGNKNLGMGEPVGDYTGKNVGVTTLSDLAIKLKPQSHPDPKYSSLYLDVVITLTRVGTFPPPAYFAFVFLANLSSKKKLDVRQFTKHAKITWNRQRPHLLTFVARGRCPTPPNAVAFSAPSSRHSHLPCSCLRLPSC